MVPERMTWPSIEELDVDESEFFHIMASEFHLSQTDIANILGCSHTTIWKRFEKYDITKKTHSEIVCEYCGRLHEVYDSHKDSVRFCSEECCSDWFSEKFKGENAPGWKGGKIKKKCEKCGNEFETYDEKQRFCSTTCHGNWLSKNNRGEKHPNWNGGKITLECDFCDKTYKVAPNKKEKSRFCSRECYYNWRRESNITTGENNSRWKGGHEYYRGKNWFQKRKKTLERDGYKCMICGKDKKEIGRNPDVHHIIPYRFSKNNSLPNLISLCREHHTEVENLLNKYEKGGYIRDGYFIELNNLLTGDSSD